jgi:hypothetical protein
MEAVVRMMGGLRRRQKTSDGGLEVRTGRNHFDGYHSVVHLLSGILFPATHFYRPLS